MAKRKVIAERENGGVEKVLKEEPEGSDDEDFDNLDVEFEWFDPLPDIDFHGIKSLLQQLFDVDSVMLDLSALTELILAQPLLGSTVKVDGKETDPYAFLSVINLHAHKDNPAVQTLIQYLKSRANSNPALAKLSELLSQPSVPSIGLVLTERLINVPAEVVPPMYTMLLEEIQWALEEKEPYQFSHYLILSKTYTEIASALDEEDDRPKKKKRAAGAPEPLYFHAEDEMMVTQIRSELSKSWASDHKVMQSLSKRRSLRARSKR
ncbi:Mss4p nuclear export [Knufia obscura]|uniref:Protein BCP1 n=1 Tax=Knufia obscura TaxID=1635080 RepID=A0ABR0RE91_9EURO|nr:Mss4p nuclear export [Knufia obscura]